MRKPLHELTMNIRKKLKNYPEIKGFENTIINVELFATGCNLVDKNIKLEEAWSILTGYDEPVIPRALDKKIISRLRILFSQYTGQAIWDREIDDYFQIPEKYRLIQKNKDGKINFLTPRFDPSRKEEYEIIIKHPIPRVPNGLDFAEAGKFTYRRMKENIIHPFEGKIPTKWIKKNKLLPDYREKRTIHFDVSFNWLSVAEEMDQIVGKDLWQSKVQSLKLISRLDQPIFAYDGIQHIGGGLAAGKSTFRTMNTYWLVTKKEAKVGTLESNVAEVLERVQELKELGINAVPIIGRSERRKHQENHLLSNPVKSLTDISSYEAFTHLSDICTIQALAGDINIEGEKFYPCKTLYQKKDKKPKKCPLAYVCGIYKDLANLIDADVWVMTPSAVLHTRIPANIDPLERLIYEAMYDLLDVIFIDEADQVQRLFDEAFLKEHSAFGTPHHLVEKLLRQLNDTMQSNYELSDNDLLTQWRKNLNHLHESVWSLYAEIKKSTTLRNSLKHQVIYLNFLIFEISRAISDDEEQQEIIADAMRNFVRESTYSSVGNSENRLHGLINVSTLKDKQKLIENWITMLGGSIPDDGNTQHLFNQIEFFVYLAHIERAMKWVLQYYPVVQYHLNSRVDVPLLTQIRDFRPFIKEAMTGVMLGYRYETKDGNETGEFKIIQYLAVGRQLMNEWPTIYEAADNKKGPAVVLLSGTSYAPKSLHYHIELEPEWYIESSRKPSTLTQKYIEIRDPQNGEKLIPVSGVQNQHVRQRNLQTIVYELSRKIEEELTHWRDFGEERKILLVVNSYDDVEVVGGALKNLSQWDGRYRLLSRNDKSSAIWFPRSRVEQFANEETADILVAPMLAISRGYNIMDKGGRGALFGTAFFLTRPYPVPNDLIYFVQILHGNLPLYLEEIENQNLTYAAAMRKIRSKSRKMFEAMYSKPDYWSFLSNKEKTILTWYTFIPTWQLIGRLLRGGKDARIYYCDAKYMDKGNSKLSMLEYWSKIMEENESNQLFMSLYGPFASSIRNIEKEGVY